MAQFFHSVGMSVKELKKEEKDVNITVERKGEKEEINDVTEEKESWEPWETKLVVFSIALAIFMLVLGLIFIPTSIINS